MSILIASQTAAADSAGYKTNCDVTLMATNGIASGEDCAIEVLSEIDGWVDSGEALSSDMPVVNLLASVHFRVSKPVSASAFGVEMISID